MTLNNGCQSLFLFVLPAAAVEGSDLHACRWKGCCNGYASFVKLSILSLIERYAIALPLLLCACSRSASYVLTISVCRSIYVPVSECCGSNTLSCAHELEGVCGCLQALTRLCEQTECDVRSCLNTLQFLARKGRPIKVADLAGLSIGQKDISKGAFTIWQDLLQIKVCKPASTLMTIHCTSVLATLLFVPRLC